MKKQILLAVWLIFCMFRHGTHAQQAKLTLQLAQLPVHTLSDSVYAAGNFNGWNPASALHRFDSNGQLVFWVQTGSLVELKCTLGSWQKVEVAKNGESVANRRFRVLADTVVSMHIAGWSQQGAVIQKKHTASPQVQVLDTAFAIQSLKRTRSIRVYLPPHYHQSQKRFPVLYMHDGQNLFDEYTASFGEWKVDETLDSLYKASGQGIIVVAIDHGGDNRIKEYSPFATPWFAEGEGAAYADFLANELRHFINGRFRTFTDPANTWVAGSSMGGVISWYAATAYPLVFGGVGVFSPAYWTSSSFETHAKALPAKAAATAYFFYAGGMESERMVADAEKMAAFTQVNTTTQVQVVVDKQGGHNEEAWARHFHDFLRFMLQHLPNQNSSIKK